MGKKEKKESKKETEKKSNHTQQKTIYRKNNKTGKLEQSKKEKRKKNVLKRGLALPTCFCSCVFVPKHNAGSTNLPPAGSYCYHSLWLTLTLTLQWGIFLNRPSIKKIDKCLTNTWKNILIIKEIPIKITLRYQPHTNEELLWKKIIRAGMDVEKKRLLHNFGEHIKLVLPLYKILWSPLKN